MTKTVIKQVGAQPRTSAVNMTLPALLLSTVLRAPLPQTPAPAIKLPPPPLVDLNILPVCIEVHANW